MSRTYLLFYLFRIPDTPAEPDLEIHAVTEPVVIPLDDQTGNAESIISYKGKPWPEPKGYPPGVPPEVVGIESPPQGVIPQMPPQFPPGPQMMAGPFPPGPFPPGPFQPHPGAMQNPGHGHGPEWMVSFSKFNALFYHYYFFFVYIYFILVKCSTIVVRNFLHNSLLFVNSILGFTLRKIRTTKCESKLSCSLLLGV
jgi:hypothetical protein